MLVTYPPKTQRINYSFRFLYCYNLMKIFKESISENQFLNQYLNNPIQDSQTAKRDLKLKLHKILY